MVRTVLTEIGLVPYWHIQGPEYEVLVPGNKGTERVYNNNPEEIIKQLAARIAKGQKEGQNRKNGATSAVGNPPRSES
ncbi:hypothetical protein B9Z55_027084 [Caenorhabditis nigoni]|uniref:Uncharacterized protein n=1 Tax=Caenorhabditis nigoni TaxID=1611254 RepID=A0A2G5SIJ8_9PELO|nr:hypothetical protein B9Z55_027084 [Caenorhabditis nigoni]